MSNILSGYRAIFKRKRFSYNEPANLFELTHNIKRMRIALIAPIIERVPPKKYGGTERVVYEITEGLVKRGHDVTLFASGDSITSAKLSSIYPRALREAKIPNLYGSNMLSLLNIGVAYTRQDEFDIIHDHTCTLGLPTAQIARVPVLMTYHGPFLPEVSTMYTILNAPFVASISKSQVKGVRGLNLAGNVYNGLSMSHYPFSEEHDGYLLFVGRLSMEKGPHFAIEVARQLDIPLILAAKLESVDMSYFKQYIEPYLSEDVRWIGEVTEEERNRLMSRALCFLHPVTWEEPFGLTLIEAMACGSPIVAFKRGSIPEIVMHKKTGFVVSTLKEMIDAVMHINEISRAACREHALNYFSADRMVDNYERIYRKIIRLKKQAVKKL